MSKQCVECGCDPADYENGEMEYESCRQCDGEGGHSELQGEAPWTGYVQVGCEHCNATGLQPLCDCQCHECPDCGGTGNIVNEEKRKTDYMKMYEPCQPCKATGYRLVKVEPPLEVRKALGWRWLEEHMEDELPEGGPDAYLVKARQDMVWDPSNEEWIESEEETNG